MVLSPRADRPQGTSPEPRGPLAEAASRPRPRSRSRRVLARLLTGTAMATVVATGLPAPAAIPAPPEVQTESVDLATANGVGGAEAPAGERVAVAEAPRAE